MKSIFRNFLCLLIMTYTLTGCSIGQQQMRADADHFFASYETYKDTVVRVAAQNGYSTLSAEVVPTPSNNWKGKLVFMLDAGFGKDNLVVDARRRGDSVELIITGAGTAADGRGASRAIATELAKLGFYIK